MLAGAGVGFVGPRDATLEGAGVTLGDAPGGAVEGITRSVGVATGVGMELAGVTA
jgi:hypothetical protein